MSACQLGKGDNQEVREIGLRMAAGLDTKLILERSGVGTDYRMSPA